MSQDNLIGKQIEEYRLENLLGRGGMARVYRALDVNLNRRVAIKIIDFPLQSDSEYIDRFRREAQAIARLEHANIVRLYRYGEIDGLLYMAMQYVEGSDLSRILQQHKSSETFIPEEQAFGIVNQICTALDYAHGQGVIHRDIKPANILISDQNDVMLTDFGLALMTEVGTKGETFGTPHYIAPEQAISSAGAVPQSDLYAMGIILYEMFTNQLPFDAEDSLDIAMQHMSEDPPRPSQLRPEFNPALETVILKTLAKNPEERYANGQELVGALKQALISGHAASAPTLFRSDVITEPSSPGHDDVEATVIASRPDDLPRQKQKSRVGLLVAIIILLVLCLGAIVVGVFLNDSSQEVAENETPIIASDTDLTVDAVQSEEDTPVPPSPTSEITTVTEVAQVTDLPTLTPTDVPTDIPTLTATFTSTPEPEVYLIQLVWKSDRSLFVINLSDSPFPIAPLYLGNDKGEVSGEEWNLEGNLMQPGECVTIWHERHTDEPPDHVACSEVGDVLTRPGRDAFWKDNFTASYGDSYEANCRKNDEICDLTIPAQ